MAEGQRKKKKKHHPAVDWLAYAALRVIVCIVHRFSTERNLRTARFLGRQLWKRYHRGRQRAIDNLRASFPEKDDAWIEAVGRRSFEQLAMLAMDVIMTSKVVGKHNWREYARFKNIERIKWMMKEGTPVILVGGHYGNFEIVGYLIGLFGFEVYGVARPLDNKYINNYLFGVRSQHGQQIIDKKGASAILEKVSKSGAAIGFLADQDAGKKGIFVDFFGRKASTYKSIGLLAIMNNIPIAVGYGRRIGDGFCFEICCSRLIMPAEWADKEDPLHWVTAEYTRAIEDFVREDPTQYWWLHRRWKHRPKEEVRAMEQAGQKTRP